MFWSSTLSINRVIYNPTLVPRCSLMGSFNVIRRYLQCSQQTFVVKDLAIYWISPHKESLLRGSWLFQTSRLLSENGGLNILRGRGPLLATMGRWVIWMRPGWYEWGKIYQWGVGQIDGLVNMDVGQGIWIGWRYWWGMGEMACFFKFGVSYKGERGKF